MAKQRAQKLRTSQGVETHWVACKTQFLIYPRKSYKNEKLDSPMDVRAIQIPYRQQEKNLVGCLKIAIYVHV